MLLLFSCSVVFHSFQLHGLRHTRLPCPSLSPRACSNSYPLSQWYHPTISSSVIPFASCLLSFPESGNSFPMSWLFASFGQSIKSFSFHADVSKTQISKFLKTKCILSLKYCVRMWETLGDSEGQGSLACCSPWGLKELDMTERLNWTELNLTAV